MLIGDAPISVQSMTNTLTSDAQATIAQIRTIEEAGADLVRVSCLTASTAALKEIVSAVKDPRHRRHPFPLQTGHRSG